jgi:hypothetical protein
LRQRVVGAGGHLGQREPLVAPGHDVAGASDMDRGLIMAALDRAATVNLEQLRVLRSTVKLKNQLGNFRSDGKHDR